MQSYLCITVRFIQPFSHGRRDGDDLEWPPSPLRLFQALVASSAGLWNERTAVKSAAPCVELARKPNRHRKSWPRTLRRATAHIASTSRTTWRIRSRRHGRKDGTRTLRTTGSKRMSGPPEFPARRSTFFIPFLTGGVRTSKVAPRCCAQHYAHWLGRRFGGWRCAHCAARAGGSARGVPLRPNAAGRCAIASSDRGNISRPDAQARGVSKPPLERPVQPRPAVK